MTTIACQAPTTDDPTVFHDAPWHRTRLGDLLSRWRRGTLGGPTAHDVGSAMIDAMLDLVVEHPAPQAGPILAGEAAALREMRKELVAAAHALEVALGLEVVGGQTLEQLTDLVAERLDSQGIVRTTAFVSKRGTSPEVAIDASPFAKMHGELAEALGYTSQIAWDTMLAEVRGAREALAGAMMTLPGPGLVARIGEIAASTNVVRATLVESLSTQPELFAGTTLISLATLVRDRLRDTRGRSTRWHDAYRAARGALTDILAGDIDRRKRYATAAANEAEANARLGEFAVSLDERVRGLDPA